MVQIRFVLATIRRWEFVLWLMFNSLAISQLLICQTCSNFPIILSIFATIGRPVIKAHTSIARSNQYYQLCDPSAVHWENTSKLFPRPNIKVLNLTIKKNRFLELLHGHFPLFKTILISVF